MNTELDLFHPKKAELKKMASDFDGLKIAWIEDKKWLDVVHKAEMELKKARVSITKICKDYTSQFDQKKKDAWEIRDEFLGIITPIEDQLKSEKLRIENEKKEIEEENNRKRTALIQSRVNELSQYNYTYVGLTSLYDLSNDDYKILLDDRKEIFDWIEVRRLANEKIEADKIEADRLKKEEDQRKIDEDQRKIAADQKKIAEDQRKIAADQKEVEDHRKKIADDKLRKEERDAEDRRTKETEARVKRETEARIRKEELEKIGKEKKDQELLEKKKKYQKFLSDNEWKYDKIITWERTVTLYKVVSKFNF